MGKKKDMTNIRRFKNLEHILSLLETIEHREDERDKIIDSFIHMKSSKITESKIIGKLRYYVVREIEITGRRGWVSNLMAL